MTKAERKKMIADRLAAKKAKEEEESAAAS